MPFEKRNTIGNKLAISAVITIIILLLFLYFSMNFWLKRKALDNLNQTALYVSKDIKRSIELYFRDAFIINHTLAGNFILFKQNKVPRKNAQKFMSGSLQQNNKLLCVWTMWEPNAYDSNDNFFSNDSMYDLKGSFAMAYYYDEGVIKTEINDTLDYQEDFYRIPAKLKNPIILDPFHYQYHGNPKVFYETSLVSPIIDKDTFLGVIGIDIDLKMLQEQFKNIKVFENGFISILSNSGQIVTHPNAVYVDNNLSKFLDKENQHIIDDLKKGKEFSLIVESEFSHKKAIRFFYPINIEYMVAPWYIMVEIPEEDIYGYIKTLRIISISVLMFLLLLIFYLVYNIIDRRRNEKNLIRALNQAEKNELELIEAHKLIFEREQLLNAIFNQAKSLMGLTTKEGILLKANQAALNMIDKQEKDLLGLYFWDCPWWTHSVEQQNKLKTIIQKASLGQSSTFETFHPGPHGNIRHILFSIKPILDNEGEVMCLLPEGIDITELKTAQEKLKNSEEKYRTLFENANDSIFLMTDERFVDCNNKTLELFACKREEIINHKPTDFSPEYQPDGKLSQEKAFSKIKLAKLGKPQFFEWKHKKTNGELFDAEVSLNKVSLQGQEFLQAIVRDVNDRKRAELELEQSEEKIRNIFNNTSDAIIILDSNFKIVSANKTFYKISGIIPVELEKTLLFDLFFNKEGTNTTIRNKNVFKKDSASGTEYLLKNKSGVFIPIEERHRRIAYEGSYAILITFNDISVRKKLEKEIFIASIDAEENERRNFAADLHDEIGPQMASINIYASMLKKRLNTNENIVLINKLMEIIKTTISDVRQLSQKLSPLLLENYGLMKAIAHEIELKRTFLQINFTQDLEDIRFDQTIEIIVYRIIKELLNNTLKHAGKTKVDILFKFEDNYLTLNYRDHGNGFDYEGLIKSTHKGLGLMNIQNRVEHVNGYSEIYSKPGQGFSFKMTIPIDI